MNSDVEYGCDNGRGELDGRGGDVAVPAGAMLSNAEPYLTGRRLL